VLVPEGDTATLKAKLDAKDAGGVTSEFAPLIAAAGSFPHALDRLRAFDRSDKLASRITALEAIVAGLPDDISVTLDPTERHGFEYQTWLGFSLFSHGTSGVIGRGGSYRIGDETAIGFSAYIDPLIDAGLARGERRRLFVPLGTPAALAQALRSDGWVTVAALDERDSAAAQICTHILKDGNAVAL